MGRADDEPRRKGRGLADVVLAAALPGAPTWRRHRRLALWLLGIGVVGPTVWLAFFVVWHRSIVGLGLDRMFLAQLVVVLIAAALARIVAMFEILSAHRLRPGKGARDAVAAVLLVAVCAPSVVGAQTAVHARDDIGRAFEDASDVPLFDASPTEPTTPVTLPPTVAPATTVADSVVPTTTTTIAAGRRLPPESIPNPPPPKPRPPDSAVDPALLADVTTILLLGGDAGPGRSGLRTDTMILVSIHRPSGRAALISVPRNLERLLFPPDSALGQRYPYGFNDIANAVYPKVASRGPLNDAYSVDGLRPGAVAIAQGLGYSLDVTIDDYVLIDMQGFVEVVDALGGVTIDVPKAVPTPGNPPNAKHPVPPIIEAGTQQMDGTLALAYVRSRKADNDYRRSQRQRAVLGALARQVGITNALAGYGAVTNALGDTLRTSLTPDEFTYLMGLIGAETAIVESMGLAPPLVNTSRPNYDEMAKIVGQVQLAIVTGQPSGY